VALPGFQYRCRTPTAGKSNRKRVSSIAATLLKLGDMGTFKEKSFADRQSAAASARKAELEKFRVRSVAIEPASAEEQSARLACKAAGDARAAERKATRLESVARETAEKVARKAAEIGNRDDETAQQATRDVLSEAERKAARDARYAARKARNRK